MTVSLIIIFSTLLIGLLFRAKQRNAKLGGEMALSKSLWLSFAILSWFILPLVFYFESLSFHFKIVLIAISLSMWIRGIIELVMLYFWKNWKPIYGIVHNVFTFCLGIYVLISNTLVNSNERIYLISIFLSLIFEIYFAYFFHKNLGKKTEGDEAIWFANATDPIYKTNLQITFIANITLYATLFYFLFSLN